MLAAFELPDEMNSRLERLMRRTGRTKEDHIREAVQDYLDELDDVALAEERLRENLPPISMQEMERRLGLED